MRAYFCFATLLFVALVNAASRPTASVPNCDAASDQWGCPFQDFRRFGNGRIDRLTCRKRPEPRMSWAIKVRHSANYTTWAGPEDAPITKYIPDTIIDVSVRVMHYRMKYRGILIYAMDSSNKRVGEWVFPANEKNPFFQLPWPNNHECRQSLTHSSAELKPLKSTFKFRTPPKGTGTITFHCLIKQGDANTGAFFWPNPVTRGPLKLTEDPARRPGQNWFISKRGQSCTERCAELTNRVCDRVHLERINSPTVFRNSILIQQQTPCVLPFVSGCNAVGVTMGNDGHCYYDDTRCAEQRRNTGRVTCNSKSGDGRIGFRLCKCINVQNTLPPRNPGRTVIGGRNAATSPAARQTTSFLIVALALLGLTLKSSGKTTTPVVLTLCLIALVAFPSVNAHNWQFSVGRSKDVASTQTPCPSKRQVGPHVQVGPNQEFEVEWAVGHTQPSYYVILKAEDEPRLRDISIDLLDRYMRDAPNSACKNLPVYHRRFAARSGDYNSHPGQFYSGAIARNAPNYIPRPESFGLWRDDAVLYGYKNNFETRDYCEYQSSVPALNFVEAVFKFDHLAHRPQDADMVRLKIPGRGGFGSYVIQWLWRGYRDCIDVDYVNRQVANIYGLPDPDGAFTRIDHCHFPDYRDIFDCHRIFDSPAVCERACITRGNGGCVGYTVMRRALPQNRYNRQANLLPRLCVDNVVNIGEDLTQVDVCFTLRARFSTETFGPYEVVHAGDPAYHSTCYVRGSGRLFPGFVPPVPHQDIPWRHGDRCISCDAVNLNKNITRVPKWPMTDDCRNCDLEPKRNTPRFDPPHLVIRNRRMFCDGNNGNWFRNGVNHNCGSNANAKSCHKRLLIRGRPSPWNDRFFANDCAAVAARDPACSDIIYTQDFPNIVFNGVKATRCFCIIKRACCNGCTPRSPTNSPQNWNVWTLHRGSS